MLLNLEKPIVFFDLETTGVNVGTDHIVEICLYTPTLLTSPLSAKRPHR